jgi:LPXTG-motif cell wall-anchored protein
MTRMRTILVALAVAATASVGMAQNADKNTAGPTKNDYRLKVVEPREGATINGSTVRVVVDTRIPAEIGTEKRDVNSMPRPQIDVFVDNVNKGTLREEQNVLEVDGVDAGAHKLVLVAKNMSGEIIGRQEINFTSNAGTATASVNPGPDTSTSRMTAPKDNDQAMNSSSTTTTTTSPRTTTTTTSPSTTSAYSAPSTTSSSSTYSAPQSTTSSSSSSNYSSSTSTSPQTSSNTSSRSMRSTSSNTARNTLPKTGTSDPLVAGAGLALLIGGYALRRRVA